MTTERTEQSSVPRRLRRRSDERVLAGVASGLGDYFNIDPLLIRIALVASVVFGGLGIFLYVAAWLLVPDDTSDRSIAERVLGRAGMAGGLVGGLLVLIGGIVFLSILANVADSSGGVIGLAIALVVIAAGAALLRGGEPAPAAEETSDAPTAAAAPRPVVRRPARPPSPLGWYVIGAVLVGVGLLALATNVTDAAVVPAHYAGLALGVIGIGLVIGTWWGHARFLIVLGVLLLPFAWTASLITVPIEGGWGTQTYSPTALEELQDEYRLAGGQLILDLRRLEGNGEPIAITASVAMGEVRVLLPGDAGLDLDASVGGGQLNILGAHQEGTELHDRFRIDGEGEQFELDLAAGLGAIRVEQRVREDR